MVSEVRKLEHNPLTRLVQQLIFLSHVKLCDSLMIAV